MPTYRLTHRAEHNLTEIWWYVAVDSPTRADSLLHRLHQAFLTLADFPNIGVVWSPDSFPDVRRFPSRQLPDLLFAPKSTASRFFAYCTEGETCRPSYETSNSAPLGPARTVSVAESSMMVTGPSLRRLTTMCAWKRPASTASPSP